MTIRTTDLAQRHFLEALAEQEKTAGGIAGMLIAMPYAIELAERAGQPAMAEVWRTLGALMRAVEADLKGGIRG